MKPGDLVEVLMDDYNGNGAARVYGLVVESASNERNLSPRYVVEPLVVFGDNGFQIKGGVLIDGVNHKDMTYIDGL